jgi:hypothetical protein
LAINNVKLDIYDPIINDGNEYETEDGVKMIEFHVDDHSELQKLAEQKYPGFGGCVSVRSDPGAKPIIMFGQDEAIYNQNLVN